MREVINPIWSLIVNQCRKPIEGSTRFGSAETIEDKRRIAVSSTKRILKTEAEPTQFPFK